MNNNVNYHWFVVARFLLRQKAMEWLHTRFKLPLAYILVFAGTMLRLLGVNKKGVQLIFKSRRIANVAIITSIIRSMIENEKFKEKFKEFLPDISRYNHKYTAGRFLLLKLPVIRNRKVIEKGAVIVKFSETFSPFYLALDLHLLSKYFIIILEPSSSGYSAEEILIWITISPEKVVVLSPAEDDYQFLAELNTNLLPMRLGAADWVNPRIFYKIDGTPKLYDAIYVANFNPVKRVDRYIRAVVKINRKHPDFKAALVCAGHGAAKSAVMAMLKRYRNRSNITFFDTMPQNELNKLFNQSKLNVLLSLKEGANKGLSEGLCAGTAALLLEENIGVKRESINSETGKIVPDSELEETLIWFSEHFSDFSPDKWAVSHISPSVSTDSLANKLREIEISEGRVWNTGLFVKVNQPELAYFHHENDWLYSKRSEFLSVFRKGTDEDRIIDFLEVLQKTNAN